MTPEDLAKLRTQVAKSMANPLEWAGSPINCDLVDALLSDFDELMSFRQQILDDMERYVTNR